MGKLQRVALIAIVSLIAIYLADFLVARSRPQGSVQVQIMWAVKQKNNRIDYELGDTETRPCVQSLLPHLGAEPCWYLTRHKTQTITVGSVPTPAATPALGSLLP